MTAGSSTAKRQVRTRYRAIALAAVLGLAAAVLAACGSSTGATMNGKPLLTWYINPDPTPPTGFSGPFGQAGIAARCSTDKYTITTQTLPQDATQQRVQLERRLEAHDSSIDLMSLDPAYTAEFAFAGLLAPISKRAAKTFSRGVLPGAVSGASYSGKLVAVPLWANVQSLWYRKSVAKKAGLDMSKPVTWDQIINAAVSAHRTVGVQANKYEGYVVWINALIKGAGGNIVSKISKGRDAKIDINSAAGKRAAAIVGKLARSPAAAPDMSVSDEGTSSTEFLPVMNGDTVISDIGAFQVNWTFIYTSIQGTIASGLLPKNFMSDVGWTTYPESVAGKPAKPPVGGINIGISAYSNYPKLATEATKCITSQSEQIRYAIETGNMPAKSAAYDSKALKKVYPVSLLALFRKSLKDAGPRPASPYWSEIVGAILSEWHPPNAVNPSSTPASSANFIGQVLHGDVLL
ncbi:MAG: extracellular solute-binding protein [Nocardioidaceae bacterium]